MAVYCLLGVLAAFGVLSLGWAAFGWLLPLWRSSVLVCLCHPGMNPEWITLCYGYLQGLGLVKAPLLLVNSTLSPAAREKLRQRHSDIDFCTLEELPSRLEQERNRFD